MASSHPVGLRIIGMLKLVSALLLASIGLGIAKWLNYEAQHDMLNFVSELHLDPQKHLIHNALAKLTGVSTEKLRAIRAGTFVYATLYMIEGIGLLKEKRWAEYLTIIITASLLPFEIYEIYLRFDTVRILVLFVNVAIVVYLWRQVRRGI